MNNCLVILYAPYETGADEPITRVRKYENDTTALWAYAESPCYWSQLCDEYHANHVAEIAVELFNDRLLNAETIIEYDGDSYWIA